MYEKNDQFYTLIAFFLLIINLFVIAIVFSYRGSINLDPLSNQSAASYVCFQCVRVRVQ